MDSFEITLLENMKEVSDRTNRLQNIRAIGGMVAADLILPKEVKNKRAGFEVYKSATQMGALLRPLGNTIYWLPPLNTKKKTLDELTEISIKAINSIF